jgi:hypothetical protein
MNLVGCKRLSGPMQLTCCFSLICQKGGWLGPPLKSPEQVPRLQRDPCLHMWEETPGSKLFDGLNVTSPHVAWVVGSRKTSWWEVSPSKLMNELQEKFS